MEDIYRVCPKCGAVKGFPLPPYYDESEGEWIADVECLQCGYAWKELVDDES